MRPFDGTDPRRFVAEFFTTFTDELVHGDEDAAAIVDRYHTPDVVQIADGRRMDRGDLVAHTRPVRKTRPDVRFEVHDAVAGGDRVAARYTMSVRDGRRDLDIDVHFFGRFAPDGRLRRAHLLTRTLPGASAA